MVKYLIKELVIKMRAIPLDDQAVGKTLGKTIYDEKGRAILREGVTLTKKYIKALKQKGFTMAYIRNELVPDLEVNEAINEETRIKALKTLRETIENISHKNLTEKDFEKVSQVVNAIIDDIKNSNQVLFYLSNIKSFDNYLFQHSINVCIYSSIIGHALHLNQLDIKKLAVGAMLHDIGKAKLPPEILNKPRKLNQKEYEIIKKHPIEGYNILRNSSNISLISAHVAFTHHERLDGSGYPLGKKGKDNIHLYGQICAVADTFDAITSNRIYRKAIKPYEAADIIKENSGVTLNPHIIKKFFENISIYPTGSIVLLNSNRIGVVTKQIKNSPEKPTILIFSENFNIVEPYEIDLYKEKEDYIKVIIEKLPPSLEHKLSSSNYNHIISYL
ncbi:HD-GYP domain-containing protein [Natranaerofaba carboxydovora]|uniref:HD-GYP domain-containing protein n=1 Tax=Natranaerofaba carboxydovora TaxID=2742683 RepID=UPI001F13A67A|nr:HD-GYP domain-containing protein [Natranaerofaba carboxydovora]